MKKSIIPILIFIVAIGILLGVIIEKIGDNPLLEETNSSSLSQTKTNTSKMQESISEISETIGETVTESEIASMIESKTTTKKSLFSKKETTLPFTSTTTATQSDFPYAYAGINPKQIEITDANWELILINRHYSIGKNYTPKLAPSVTTDPNSKQLDYRVAPHYNEMYQAAAKEGIYLTPLSGYRSYDRQKTNFENKIDKYIKEGYSKADATNEAAKIILPPGTSEHNAGLAMDITSLEQSFENSKAFAWLSENAADYGFILRYPKDKQHITEIIYEPWHWRYVGVENAKKIKSSGLCLEEYLAQNR